MFRAVSLAALAFLAALVAACGSGASSGGADPASAVPANAPFYVEAVVRPEGDLRDDALDAAGKVLRTDDPSGRISELIDQALKSDNGAKLDYDKDIKPWLGERAGAWFSDFGENGNGDPKGAVMVAVTDQDAAQAAVEKGRKQSGDKLTDRSYDGTDYQLDQDGTATGVTEDLLISGPEAEFKRTLDTLKDGKGLSDSDRYKNGLDKLADDRLGHFYVDFKQLLKIGFQGEPSGEEQLRQFEQLVPLEKVGPIMGSFAANGDRLAVDVGVDVEGAKSLGALGNLTTGASTDLMKDLPGDTWGAFGAPKYGASLKASLDAFGGAIGGAALQGQLKQRYGIDLNEDVLSWIGDVAFFIRGDTIAKLDGGAVIQVTDEAKAATGFGKLVGLLQSEAGLDAKPITIDGAETAFAVTDASAPKPIVFARGSGKVVIAYGAEAAAAAMKPADKLGDSEIYGQAKDALEDLEPGLLVSVPSIISLVEASGSADASWDKAKPYLEAYDVIALGAEGSGGHAKVRIAAGLK
jgi:hypothetical protein